MNEFACCPLGKTSLSWIWSQAKNEFFLTYILLSIFHSSKYNFITSPVLLLPWPLPPLCTMGEWHRHGGQRTTLWTQFSSLLLSLWGCKTELRAWAWAPCLHHVRISPTASALLYRTKAWWDGSCVRNWHWIYILTLVLPANDDR